MSITQVGHRVHIEVARRVDGCIEHEAHIAVPVTIDVLRTRNRSTSRLNVRGLLSHRIARSREVHEGHHGTLVLGEVVVIEKVEVLSERRLQAWVTS